LHGNANTAAHCIASFCALRFGDGVLFWLGNRKGVSMKVEQADGGGGSKYHSDLKRLKHRLERREARNSLRNGEQPVPDHKYKGWEL